MKNIRSLLFVPADEKRLVKIGKTNADAYIIDLEDSIDETNKEDALQRVRIFLETCNEKNLYVRVNKNRHLHELEVLSKFPIGIVLPKIETIADYSDSAKVLVNRNVIALIETPRAILNSSVIASIPWIDALAFGAEDFTVATGMLNSCEYLFVPKSILSLSVKANGKLVFDTPCFYLNDNQMLEMELKQALNLGFDGKLAIHPQQVDDINRAFCIQDNDYLRYVVETFQNAKEAVCEIDGKVYEQIHINRIIKQLERV